MKKTTTETKPKATAAGVPVYCAHDAIIRAADLKPNPKNPNKHPDEQIERLGAVIRGNGWRNPITVSTRSGLVVKDTADFWPQFMKDLTRSPSTSRHTNQRRRNLQT